MTVLESVDDAPRADVSPPRGGRTLNEAFESEAAKKFPALRG